jgi:SAM-dependent methyltransferase
LGHAYVAIDNGTAAADLLGDAHAIPFQADSFDCVFSYAVLAHLHSPFLALHEIRRVLRPGGVFCGTVSQGEAFQSSLFHHTAWGLISLAASSEMAILRLWPSYDTLLSLDKMGRYPRLPPWAGSINDHLARRFERGENRAGVVSLRCAGINRRGVANARVVR